ncbi:MAG: GYD domain-containing protein [Rhodobacter sp.]|nr:GYD domain-containing protein [Rhodobacter sp.]
MPFYMFQGQYTSDSINAMIDTPQDREAAARGMIEALGGTLHHFFFCFGSEDVVAIMEMPDDTAMTAGSMLVGGSGAMSSGRTTKLITMADAMEAMATAGKTKGHYHPVSG